MLKSALCGLASFLASSLPATQSSAAPPENADPKLREWFEGLRQPSTGAPCCSISDCRRTQARHNESGWDVLIDERFGSRDTLWTPVPRNRVLDRNNPTGEPIVCFLPGLGVMCFVPPPET